ncbi:MAG: hypothetical protein HOW73_32195 [Polyangiaceae bacterium]|nr:hypothetical protein [Polyangiaceae bacterium]
MNETAQKRFLQAREAFGLRGFGQIVKAQLLLTELDESAGRSDLAGTQPLLLCEGRLLLARAITWRAERAGISAQYALAQRAVDVATAASHMIRQSLEGAGRDTLEGMACYYCGLAQAIACDFGRRTDLYDVARSAIRYARVALRLNPHVDAHGPNRLLGRIYAASEYFVRPPGDLRGPIDHLRHAAEKSPSYAGNHFELARALAIFGHATEARQTLDALLARDPATMAPEFSVEVAEDLARAKSLRSELL